MLNYTVCLRHRGTRFAKRPATMKARANKSRSVTDFREPE